MNSLEFRQGLLDNLPKGMHLEVCSKLPNIDNQLRIVEAVNTGSIDSICDAVQHTDLMNDLVAVLRKKTLCKKKDRYVLKDGKNTDGWKAAWAKRTGCNPYEDKDNLQLYSWSVNEWNSRWDSMLLSLYFKEHPLMLKLSIAVCLVPFSDYGCRFYGVRKGDAFGICKCIEPQPSAKSQEILSRIDDEILGRDQYGLLHVTEQNDVLPITLYYETTFERLVAAFDRVYRDVMIAKNNIHEQGDTSSRSVKQKTEICLRFRESQTLDLGDGEPFLVPRCKLTFSGGSLIVSGYINPVVGSSRWRKNLPADLIHISSNGIAMSEVNVRSIEGVGQHLQKYLLLLAKLENGNFSNLARKIATLSRACIFCNHPLTNSDSIKLGAGDYCMKTYGHSLDNALLHALPQASADHVPDVRLRTLMEKIKERIQSCMSEHAMWVLQSDAHFEGLRECLESDCESSLEVETKLFDFVKRITGVQNVERACKDLHMIHKFKGGWIPASHGVSLQGIFDRVLDAVRVAEHFGNGEQHALLEWVCKNRERYSSYSLYKSMVDRLDLLA